MSRRILYLAPFSLRLQRGHAVHVRRLTAALRERGHRVRVVSLEDADANPSSSPDSARAEDRPAPGEDWVRVSRDMRPKIGHVVSQRRLGHALREEVRSFVPDAVAHRVENLCWAAGTLRGCRSAVVAESCSSIAGHRILAGRSSWKASLATRTERNLLRTADRVRVLTRALAEVQHSRHGLEIDRMEVVPVGAVLPVLDPARDASLRVRENAGADELVCAFVGSFNAWQGGDRLIEACAALPPALRSRLRIWMIGSGELEASWRELAASLHVGDRVRFCGSFPESEALALAAASHVLAAPYVASRSAGLGIGDLGPLKVVQGMACDRPVLCSGLPRWETGGAEDRAPVAYLDESIEAWRDALARWIARWDAAGRPSRDWPWPTGESPGRRLIAAEQSWPVVAEKWEQMMERALAERDRRLAL